MILKSIRFYGIDAPKVVRNLFFCFPAALILAALSFFIEDPRWFWLGFSYSLLIALAYLGTGLWMLYSTSVAKPRILSEAADKLALKGDEKILDVGCGRGMFLIELAKRLPQGKVYGVDLWLSKDQSGNSMEQTLTNAKDARVDGRVELQTSDIRSLPYADGTFDAVVSSLVIHNIEDEDGRNQALSEILRVLKPGGKFTLLDIRNGVQYARFINQTKVGKANYSKLILSYCPFLRIVEGIKEN